MGEPRRDPRDPVAVVRRQSRHHDSQPLGHGVVHNDISAAFRVTPAPFRGRDSDSGEVGPPRRYGVAAIFEQSRIVVGAGRRRYPIVRHNVLIRHASERLGNHEAMQHAAVFMHQRREIDGVARKFRGQCAHKLFGRKHGAGRRKTGLQQGAVDVKMLEAERIRLCLGTRQQQHDPAPAFRQRRPIATGDEVVPIADSRMVEQIDVVLRAIKAQACVEFERFQDLEAGFLDAQYPIGNGNHRCSIPLQLRRSLT